MENVQCVSYSQSPSSGGVFVDLHFSYIWFNLTDIKYSIMSY